MTDAWDGRPLNPERDGWHWVQHHLSPAEELPLVRYWDAAEHDWPEYFEHSETYVATRYRYLGPCLTPAEVAAREAAAFVRGAGAMRERAAEVLATTHERIEWFNTETNGAPLVVKGERDFVRLGEVRRFIRHEAARIRALPVPEDRNEQG